MRIRLSVLSIVSLALLLPTALSAQNLQQLCSDAVTIDVGLWAEYEVTGEPQMTSMRYAAIGEEELDGEPHRWYEMTVSGAQTMVAQMLLPGDRFSPNDVKKMRVQPPGQPVMEMEGQMLDMARQNMDTDDIYAQCIASTMVGEESVTVPAGTIDATHLTAADGWEVWVSTDIPFGMVKMVDEDGTTFLLKEHGTGATSSIN